MRVKSVTFGFTKNLGNYQSARAEVTVEVSETGSFDTAMLLASGIVREALSLPTSREESVVLDRYRGRESDQ